MGFFDWLFPLPPRPAGHDDLDHAIDQVMASADPRLKVLTGARERLSPAVARALVYARHVSTRQPPAIPLGAEHWAHQPILRALFVQPDEISHTINQSPDLREYLDHSSSPATDQLFCIVAVTPAEHVVLGTAMDGEMLRREVEQHVVSFGDFRLLGFSPGLPALQVRIQEMVLEALVLDALAKIAADRRLSQSLEAEHSLLLHRLNLFSKSRAGLNSLEVHGPHHQDLDSLRQQLMENEQRLADLKPENGWLEATLAKLVECLTEAPRTLPIQPLELWLNAMNVLQPPQAPDAMPVTLLEVERPQRPRRLYFPAIIASTALAPRHLDIDGALRLL